MQRHERTRPDPRARGAGRSRERSPARAEGTCIDWLTIAHRERSVVADVARIRNHPLVPGRIPIYRYVYEVETGRLVEIPEAIAAGKAR